MSASRVAFVVQRYGADVTGGSEALARAVAERLAPTCEIDVYTSCARDYVTWRNELPPGDALEAGVRVRRFPVERERDLAAFNRFAEELYVRERSRDEELQFLDRQGPCVPRLVEALERERDRYGAVVFFTYLYYPTYWGLQVAAERSVLVPTTHDEPPLRFGIYREVFARARGFGFLTPAEETLARSRFDLDRRPSAVVAMGVDLAEPGDVAAFRRRYGLERPYVLYAGRIDAGKGCAEMVAHHALYRRSRRDGADLVMIGRLAMPLGEGDGVRHLGFLSEQEKAAALAGARAVVCSSPYESFSIVLLEGFAQRRPGLVNGRSAVLKEHCLRSNGALYYEDSDEYVEALDLLVTRPGLADTLGEAGRRYVESEYRWDVVLERWRGLISAAGRP